MRAFAATHPGLEGILRLELEQLGARAIEGEAGGVGFDADLPLLYRANLALATASRVIVRVATFKARTFGELERHAKKVGWEEYIAPGAIAHFRVTSKKSKLFHEDGIAERLTTALQARVSGVDVLASRAEADDRERDVTVVPTIQRFVVRFHRDGCTLSADSSGSLLHRRGYRLDSGKAPLRETLAAGLVLASGWTAGAPLIDPFCGSGTIPIEAAMIARRMPPGWRRRFGFERWPGFDRHRYDEVRAELAAAILPSVGASILGADRDAGAIRGARENAERSGTVADIEWRCQALSALTAPPGAGWVITNPPYGARLKTGGDLRNLYAQLGHLLRRQCPGWRATIVGADRVLEGQVGLDWAEGLTTENGGLPMRFLSAAVPAS
jgi:putative N6-adenine-specific DNA methylase